MFKKSNQQEWIAKANADLKGKVEAENLRYSIEDGLSISPFLTHNEVDQKTSIDGPKTMAGIQITFENTKEANIKAKEMLNNAAEVLAFDVSKNTNFSELLDGIFIDMITLILYTYDEASVRSLVSEYLSNKYANKKTNVIIVSPENTVYLGVNTSFKERINNVRNYVAKELNDYLIIVDLKKDFLVQISELRAIRRLSDMKNRKVFIVAMTTKDAFENTDIHPLIITNYLLMSAYLGMCDAAFGIPYDNDRELARLSLNIHNVLKEESAFNFVTDPTAGAYVIEKITQELLDSCKN